MKIEKLSNLVDISIGRTPSRTKSEYWGKGHKWVSIRDLRSKIIYDTNEEITNLAVKEARCKIVPKGTLLFSFKLTIGKMAFSGCDLFTNEAIAAFAIKNKDKLDSNYLYYALKSANFVGSNQAVMGKTLNSKSLAEIEVPFPPFDEQVRIVHLLSKVEGLISQRKQHLKQLDDLLKSVFLEMFGATNPSSEEWPLVEIRTLAAKHKGAMRTGPFGSNLLHSEFTPDGDVAVLGIDNAVQNHFAWGERRFITNEKYKELESYRVFPGDVIITIMGTIGRSAVIPDDIPLAINTKHLAAITVDKKLVHPVFLSYSIRSDPFILNQFKNKDRGAIMSGLNLTIIKETNLRKPPIELQNQFAVIVEKIEGIKARYQVSLAELERLYGGLSQRAFKGELDLSRIPATTLSEEIQTQKNKQTQIKEEIPYQVSTPLVTNEIEYICYPPEDINDLNSNEGRLILVKKWLHASLSKGSIDGGFFSLSNFIETAKIQLEELIEETANIDVESGSKGFLRAAQHHAEHLLQSNTSLISLSEYEALKEYVFEQLEQEQLWQVYESISNQLRVKV